MALNIAMIFELGPNDEGSIGGGVELHAINLAKELVKLGHAVTYISGAIPGSKNQASIEGVKIKRIDFGKAIRRTYDPQQLNFSRQLLFLLKSIFSRTRKSKQETFDICHGHIYSAGIVAKILARRNKAKAVNTIHGSYYKYWNQIVSSKFKAGFYRKMEHYLAPYLVRKAAAQIHTDYDFAETVKKWVKPKYKDRIITILNGVDIKKFSLDVEPNSKISSKVGPIVMTSRRLVAKNGVIFLVQGFEKVIQSYPNAILVIIGDGPERARIQEEIQKLKLISNVHMIGMIPNDEIPSYLIKADIVAVPSIVEASSISVLEAMAMKKPVVASDIPGIREITKFGENCVLVPPMKPSDLADGICGLLESKKLRKELGEKGYKEIIENYTWEKKAKEIEQLYYNIIDSKPPDKN
jgi:glycosyltransferase involved in cell wall biosynthesis